MRLRLLRLVLRLSAGRLAEEFSVLRLAAAFGLSLGLVFELLLRLALSLLA